MLNLGQNRRFFIPCDLEIWRMTSKNNRAPLLCCFKLCASFHNHRWIQTNVTVRKSTIQVKIGDLLSCVALKFDGWPWKTIGYLFYVASSFMDHFIAISEFKLKLQSRNAPFGSKSAIFCPVWPWNLTDDLEKAHLLSNIKLYASFHHHMWIQTGITVQKRLSWVMTSVTLTFDLLPWPFAWTSLLSWVITPEISWWYDNRNIVKKVWQTEERTDGQKGVFLELLGRS